MLISASTFIIVASLQDLKENSPTLFQALTDQNDAQGRWSVVTFPVDIDMTAFLPASKNTLGQTGEAGPGDQVLVLQKVASELHPKVRNHGEGPY